MSEQDNTIGPLYEEIQDRLKRPVEARHISSKRVQGNEITFMSWAHIAGYLDDRAPGWDWEIERLALDPGKVPEVGFDASALGDSHYGGCPPRLFLVGRLTIHGSDRSVTRCATGTEKLSKDSYGDPITSAESTCLRRAAAKHGFMREMWIKGAGPNVVRS